MPPASSLRALTVPPPPRGPGHRLPSPKQRWQTLIPTPSRHFMGWARWAAPSPGVQFLTGSGGFCFWALIRILTLGMAFMQLGFRLPLFCPLHTASALTLQHPDSPVSTWARCLALLREGGGWAMRHHPTALSTPSPRTGQPGPGSAAERQGYGQTSWRGHGRGCVGGGQGLGLAQVGRAGCEPCRGPGTGSWSGGDAGRPNGGPGVPGADPALSRQPTQHRGGTPLLSGQHLGVPNWPPRVTCHVIKVLQNVDRD